MNTDPLTRMGVGVGVERTPRLLYVIGTYPSLTTTFIDREIEVLRGDGVPIRVVSIRRPEHPLSRTQRILQQSVRYVLPVSPVELLTSHVRRLMSRPMAYVSTCVYLISRRHASVRSRVKTLLHFGVAVHVAEIVARGPEVDHVHAHFVDRAATVALVVSRLLGLPYSVTAHANDIYVDPVLLPEKLGGASFVATCTRYNAAHLSSIAEASAPEVVCVPHGLDLGVYPPDRDGASPVPIILAVAQLRRKKGLVHLIDACAELSHRGYSFSCEIVGEGPLRQELELRIRQLGVGHIVTLAGALDHAAVIDRYRRASVFALPCVTAPDGDRDGIPNVILEAMAMELPVVSTRHSGIPEAVEDGASGVLVEPHDPAALAEALAGLLDDPARRRRLGRRGRQIVLESFDIRASAERLLQRFTAVETEGG